MQERLSRSLFLSFTGGLFAAAHYKPLVALAAGNKQTGAVVFGRAYSPLFRNAEKLRLLIDQTSKAAGISSSDAFGRASELCQRIASEAEAAEPPTALRGAYLTFIPELGIGSSLQAHAMAEMMHATGELDIPNPYPQLTQEVASAILEHVYLTPALHVNTDLPGFTGTSAIDWSASLHTVLQLARHYDAVSDGEASFLTKLLNQTATVTDAETWLHDEAAAINKLATWNYGKAFSLADDFEIGVKTAFNLVPLLPSDMREGVIKYKQYRH